MYKSNPDAAEAPEEAQFELVSCKKVLTKLPVDGLWTCKSIPLFGDIFIPSWFPDLVNKLVFDVFVDILDILAIINLIFEEM